MTRIIVTIIAFLCACYTWAGNYKIVKSVNGQGCIIKTADGTTVGYTDSNEFDESNMPEALKILLDINARTVDNAAINSQNHHNNIRRASRQAIAPLVQTQWNQSSPYNDECPRASAYGSSKCPAGCVAIALGQVMAYHQHPAQTTKAIPDYEVASGMKNYGKALPIVAFNWSGIINSSKYSVPEFIKYVGAAVKMEYSADGSGADVADIPFALTEYFNYDASVRCVSRNQYSYDEWHTLIYNELRENRPVVLGGTAIVSGGLYGHAFVCDGYDGKGFFHINWGWKGKSDGYYSLDLLSPVGGGEVMATSADGYSIFSKAVVGIQHTGAQKEEEPAPIDMSTALKVNSVTLTGNQIANVVQPIKISISNLDTTKPYYGNIILYEGNDENAKGITGTSINLEPGETRDVTLHYKSAATGERAITITETADEDPATPENVVYIGTVTLYSKDDTPVKLSYITSIDFSDPTSKTIDDDTFTFRIRITNNSSSLYEDEYTVQLRNAATTDVVESQTKQLSVAPGKTKELVFAFTTVELGKKYYAFYYEGPTPKASDTYSLTMVTAIGTARSNGKEVNDSKTSLYLPREIIIRQGRKMFRKR